MVNFLSKISVNDVPLDDAYASLAANIVPVASSTYTLQLTDSGKIIEFTDAGAVTISCPTGLPVGFQCILVNIGGGDKTIEASGGASIYTKDSKVIISGAYNAATVYYRAINEWVGFGNLS